MPLSVVALQLFVREIKWRWLSQRTTLNSSDKLSLCLCRGSTRRNSHCVEHVLPGILFVVQRSPAARPAQCAFITLWKWIVFPVTFVKVNIIIKYIFHIDIQSDLIACPENSHFYEWGTFCFRRYALITQVECIKYRNCAGPCRNLLLFMSNGNSWPPTSWSAAHISCLPTAPDWSHRCPFSSCSKAKGCTNSSLTIFLSFGLLSDACGMHDNVPKPLPSGWKRRFNLATVLHQGNWCDWLIDYLPLAGNDSMAPNEMTVYAPSDTNSLLFTAVTVLSLIAAQKLVRHKTQGTWLCLPFLHVLGQK